MKLQRIQRKREKGWRMPPDTVYVGRPSRWGNKFPPETEVEIPMTLYDRDLYPVRIILTLEQSLEIYEGWLDMEIAKDPEFLAPLRGKNLACWCSLGEPCYADILLRRANEESEAVRE